MSRVSGGDPGGVSLMPGSGGRGGLPSSGCEPHHQALSLIYALPSFHRSLYPSPRRGSPPSDLRPLSQPRTLEACLHTPFSRKPSHAYLLLGASRLPLSLPALLLLSPPPPLRAPILPLCSYRAIAAGIGALGSPFSQLSRTCGVQVKATATSRPAPGVRLVLL